MSLSSIEKEVRKMLANGGHIESREADRLTQMILADNFVSRTEKRFVKRILQSNACDDRAFHKLDHLLLVGDSLAPTFIHSGERYVSTV